MKFDIILAAVIIIVAAHFIVPVFENWQARRAAEKRLREVIKH